MPLLTLDRISLAYGHLPLLERADLRIEPGERSAPIGREGAGKSSRLKMVGREIPPDAGAVWRAPGLRIPRLAQDASDASDRTVRDEVASGLPAVAADAAWSVAHKVDVVLTRLALPADRAVAELSGGWKRRVLLGRA